MYVSREKIYVSRMIICISKKKIIYVSKGEIIYVSRMIIR